MENIRQGSDNPQQNILITQNWPTHKFLLSHSAAKKGWSAVHYCQYSVFDRAYLSCDDHCDRWLFQEIFFLYQYNIYFLEIILNDLELVFLEFKHIYKTQRSSLFSSYLSIFTRCFVIILCINVLHLFILLHFL